MTNDKQMREAFESYRDTRNAALAAEGHRPYSRHMVDNSHYQTWLAAIRQSQQAQGCDHDYVDAIHNQRREVVCLHCNSPDPSVYADGWKLVPAEPTDEMISAGADASKAFRVDILRSYEAMVSAAPSAQVSPQAQGEAAAWQFYQDGKWYTGMNTNNHRENTEAAGYPVRDLYAHPPAPVAVPGDGFDGDNHHLASCISSLLRLDESGSMSGERLGGHARSLLSAAASRLNCQESPTDKDQQQAALFRAHNGGED